ncbi:hypothetical protein [Sandaracinobacter neustonicus]|nr:hypothetical protein [Sandaracinobacter neustonicus]
MAALLAACTPASAPSAEDLAIAIGVDVGMLRHVRCERVPNDPTEFVCRYQQRAGADWTHMEAVAARNGMRWVLIDTPGKPD